MRLIFSFVTLVSLSFLCLGSASFGSVADLFESSNSSPIVEKPRTIPWVGPDHSTPKLRQGGDDMTTAFPISSLPFADTGTTCGYNEDFTEQCPTFALGPDVVYTYTPGSDLMITVDMCGSFYDTFIWIWDDQMNVIACNDDYYGPGDPCGTYVSKIEQASLQQGMTYYIFVAGYAGCGDYQMTMTEYLPCVLGCAGVSEGEPALYNGYVDVFNGGCYDANMAFQSLSGDLSGELEFCGKGGWYQDTDGDYKMDTDWFMITVGSTGVVEWVLEAEQWAEGYHLQAGDCDNIIPPLANIIVSPCNRQSIVLKGIPGEVLWLLVGANQNSPPNGFVGNEYNYICTFTGLAAGPVATEALPWGGIKSRYR